MLNLRGFYHSLRNSPRKTYWGVTAARDLSAKLRLPQHAAFAQLVSSEAEHLANALANDSSADEERLAAAVDWTLRAQRATPDAGVSLGYFPIDTPGGWRSSYPETTGYIITTLLKYAERYQRADVREAALEMARWEAEVQMPSGAVQGGPVAPPERQTPAAFNTGMVLDGWCSAFEATKDSSLLDAAIKAARFLAADMDEHGFFQTSGQFVSQGETKTYNCLCAWAMMRLALIIDDESLKRAAIRAIEGVLERQRSNGWFSNNCLTLSAIPLTHTIGYTFQGVLEVGVLAQRPDFIAAIERGLAGLLPQVRGNGFLAGRFDADWRPAANFVCLTGSCQLAVVAYRVDELSRRNEYSPTADRLVDFVKATQRLEAEDLGVRGAIAGSYPLLGEYMTAGYPNWATKYFMDALLARIERRR